VNYIVLRNPEPANRCLPHPTCVHLTRESAEREASRLAALTPGEKVFVAMLVTEACLPSPAPNVVKLDSDDLPF
jgi:hypothetical protein